MYVVSVSNKRKEAPSLDMRTIFSASILPGGTTGDVWKHSFIKSPVEVLVTDLDRRMALVLRIRGYVHDVTQKTPIEERINDVFIGGTRVPVIDTVIVGRMGNKIIVDVKFMISVTDVKIIESNPSSASWGFHLSTPGGFRPATLLSTQTRTNYLCSLVEDPTAMAVEISPVSFTLMWPRYTLSPLLTLVTVNSVPVDLPAGSLTNRLSIGASPETDYVCVIDNGTNRYEVVLRTPRVSRESYETHYRSCKTGDRTYDLSNTDQSVIRDLRRLGVIAPGDRVILGGTTDGAMVAMVAVGTGETISTSGVFYVIPTFEENTEQYICMETSLGFHVISFDNTESFVGYNSNKYVHGDKFVIDSRVVEVAKGSLILIITDEAPLVFPGGVTTASQVATAGDIVLRDLILKSSSQVTTKETGGYTYGNTSYYVYDSVNGTTLEATRVIHGLDESGETGSMSFNVLYTPSSGANVLHSALEIDPSETKIRAIDSTGSLDATFDVSGLRFNSNSGDVYFGASQEFRIHYEAASGNDPSMLQIQGYSTDTGEYVTRQLITNEPVG